VKSWEWVSLPAVLATVHRLQTWSSLPSSSWEPSPPPLSPLSLFLYLAALEAPSNARTQLSCEKNPGAQHPSFLSAKHKRMSLLLNSKLQAKNPEDGTGRSLRKH